MARLFGLSPDQKSFIFKMSQNLLPTRERLHRIGKSPSPLCSFCNGHDDTPDHMFSCPQSMEITTPLLACLSSQTKSLTPKDVTEMRFKTSESWELPAAWLVSTCLGMVWDDRLAGRATTLVSCRADILARVALLRRTKWKHFSLHNSALLLDEALNLHFN